MGKRANKVLAIFGIFLSLGTTSLQADANCVSSRVEIQGDFGAVQFRVDVAATPEERARGLMFRETMPRMNGMIFEFASPQPTSFWMKNTLIPLDMIFADKDGVIQTIHQNAIPHDTTPIFGGNEIKFVLEINAGMSKALGISEQDRLSNPLNEDELSWVCR